MAISGAGDRARAFRQARRHTLLVRLARTALPVAAVLSLGGFLLGRPISVRIGEGTLTVKLPTFDGEQLAMENPTYEGTGPDGSKYFVTAKLGFQDVKRRDIINLRSISGNLVQLAGQKFTLVADEGVYDSKKEQLKLSGSIKITTSDGMVAYLKTAEVDMKTHVVVSHDPVRAENALGSTLDALAMTLDTKTKEAVFEGAVRTHLVPPPDSKAEKTSITSDQH